MRWWLRAAFLSLLAGTDGTSRRDPGRGGGSVPGFGPGLRSRCHRSSRPGAGSGQSGAVVGRVGDSAVLGCDLLGAQPGRPPLYVIEWVRVGFVLPIFIKFGLYSPRVDPEYSGEGSAWGPGGGGGVGVRAAVGWGGGSGGLSPLGAVLYGSWPH